MSSLSSAFLAVYRLDATKKELKAEELRRQYVLNKVDATKKELKDEVSKLFLFPGKRESRRS